MDPLRIILIVILALILFGGGGYGWQAGWGHWPIGLGGIFIVVLLVLLITGRI